MKNRREVARTAAIAAVLAAPLAIGSHPAPADELADLRANQELLQRRLEQLAQEEGGGGQAAPDKNASIGGYPGPTSEGPATVQMMGDSFPRSFLIPGTDTSLRVGGRVQTNATYWITG